MAEIELKTRNERYTVKWRARADQRGRLKRELAIENKLGAEKCFT